VTVAAKPATNDGVSGTVALLCAGLLARMSVTHCKLGTVAAARRVCCWWLAAPQAPSTLPPDTECIVCRGSAREDVADSCAAEPCPAALWQTLRCGCVMHVACLHQFGNRKPGYWQNPKCLQCQREWLKLCVEM
jgi:hypothetical protein